MVRPTLVPTGTANWTVFYVKLKNPHQSYEVVFYDRVSGSAQSRFLEESIQGESRDLHAKVVSEKAIQLDGFPGLGAVIENQSVFVATRWFVVGNRIYHIAVIMDKRKVVERDLDRFLNSFRIQGKSR